jgi:hypothetical protein
MKPPSARSAAKALATTALLGAVGALGLAGCSFGAGSSYIGQWMPRENVAFEACLREAGPPSAQGADECKERKQVIIEEPGRRFWGVILSALQFGGSSVTYRSETNTQFRFQPSIELLRGEGRWAYGVRTGFLLETYGDQSAEPTEEGDGLGDTSAFDVMAVGHVALFERLSAYVGAGYIPYASVDELHTSLAGRGLVGVQLGLSRTHSTNHIVLTLELDHMYLHLDGDPYRSTGLTGHVGIFF